MCPSGKRDLMVVGIEEVNVPHGGSMVGARRGAVRSSPLAEPGVEVPK